MNRKGCDFIATSKEKPYLVNGEYVTLEEYRKTKYEDLRVRVPKGKKTDVQAHASTRNESLNAFVNRAIDETIERDNNGIEPTEELKQYNVDYIGSKENVFYLDVNKLYSRLRHTHVTKSPMDFEGDVLREYIIGSDTITPQYLNQQYDGKKMFEELKTSNRKENVSAEWLDQFIIKEVG